MTKHLLVFLFLYSTSLVHSQSYFADFESLNNGDLIAESDVNWTTWSGALGGIEDAPISDVQASSGTKALYFSSNLPNGGPQDVVLPLGGHYTDGHMSISMEIFVEDNKGGHFNLQGLPTNGEEWALSIFFLQTGEFFVTDNSGIVGSSLFNSGEWWNLELDLDMTLNSWEIFINGVSLGAFSSPSNQVASIDFYPLNAAVNGGNDQSGFFIDDLSYQFTPYSPLALDAALFTIDVSSLGLTGQSKEVSGSIINLGNEELNSFDIEWSYGSSSGIDNITGLSISNLETYDFTLSESITLVEGANTLQLNITNVNGQLDDALDNNDGSKSIEAVTAAPGKMVIAEEHTGTWCGWCIRGAVFMNYMHENYEGFFQGISVHNGPAFGTYQGDPMLVDEYDSNMNNSSFPNINNDRNGYFDPLNVEEDFISRIQEEVNATIDLEANYSNGQIDISANINAINDLLDYSLAIAIIENNVMGSGSNGWDQENNYSGGTVIMGGFENLPNPIPAEDMVYDNVARAILGGFNGMALDNVLSGNTTQETFSYIVPVDQDVNQMKAVAMLIEPNGRINNGAVINLEATVGLEDTFENRLDAKLFPNPANDFTQLTLNLEQASSVSIQLIDVLGKTVFARNYGTLNGNKAFPINTSGLANGTYIIQAQVGEIIISRKLVIRK